MGRGRWIDVGRWSVAVAMAIIMAGCSGGGSDSVTDDAAEADEADPSTLSSETGDATTTAEEVEAPVAELSAGEILDIWQRADDAVFEPDDQTSQYTEILAPANEGDGWTIVGSVRDHATSRGRAAVWEYDELVWNSSKRIDLSPQSDEHDEHMSDVVHFGDMRLAGGSRGSGPNQRAAIWVGQPDGSWEALDAAALSAGTGENQPRERVTSMRASKSDTETATQPETESESTAETETGSGTVDDLAVAIGIRTASDGSERAVMWISADGQTWDKVEPDQLEQDDDASPTTVAIGPEGIVATGSAVGEGLQSQGRVWLSPDGRSWTVVNPEAMADGYNIVINSVERTADRYVAVGSLRASADDPTVPASWTSTDGESWNGPFRQWEITDDDGRTNTAGFGVSKVVVQGDRLFAKATDSFMQHVWTSTDGQTWQAVGDIWDVRDAGVRINGLASDGTSVAAVTSEPAVIYHDGEWNEIRLDKKATPSPSQKPFTNDITWTPEGFIAVGGFEAIPGPTQYEIEAESWVSTDGQTWEKYLSLGRNEWGSINSVAVVNDEPFATLTERVDHATAANRQGMGLALRTTESSWSVFYEHKADERRSGVSSIVQAGDEVVVGGWQFSADRTRTDARIGTVSLAELGAPAQTPLNLEAPSVWSGAGHDIQYLCGNDDDTVVAVANGLSDSRGSTMLVAVRGLDGTWIEQAASDNSFFSSESQAGRACLGGPQTALIGGWTYDGTENDAAIWLDDGAGQWRQVDSDVLGGDGNQWISGGVRVGDRYIFSGSADSGGSAQASLWIGQGSEWSALPIGPEAWSLQSVDIAADAADRSDADLGETTIVIAGWQYGRTAVYHTTLAEIDEALAAMADLESD